MIFVCVIIVVAPPDGLQELRDIYAQEAAQFRQRLESLQASSHAISCSCGWHDYYPTPGRAKMGLSGHQRWCRK
jgi:hypothetical protein